MSETTPQKQRLPAWRLPTVIAMVFLWITTAFFLWLPGQIEVDEATEPDWTVQVYTRENPLREGGRMTLQVFVYDKPSGEPIREASVTSTFSNEEVMTLHHLEAGLYEGETRVMNQPLISGEVRVSYDNQEATRSFEYPVEPFGDQWTSLVHSSS
ncbi:hypothetical protein [Alteribacter populi]|uniref:hypothetical protein n=1 Tax=Alteribacter populi TaxID=2011011 RepID=UPI000BBAC217|nr:hypothetical protein [Alteribacter populi]